jgi:uncharacterized membrane protein YqjE
MNARRPRPAAAGVACLLLVVADTPAAPATAYRSPPRGRGPERFSQVPRPIQHSGRNPARPCGTVEPPVHLVRIVHIRLELLSTELQEELTRVAVLWLWGAAAPFFIFLCVTSVGPFVVIALWDEHWRLASGAVAVLFLLLAILAAVLGSRQISAKPHPFRASLKELAKDRERLGPPP